MPTVFTDEGLSYRIYTADHRPAHVHVVGGGCEAVFELRCPDGPPELREAHGFRFARTKRIAAVIGERLRELCAEWGAIHGQ